MEATDTRAMATLLRQMGFALCKPDRGTKNPTETGWPTRSLEPQDFTLEDLLGILGGPLSDGNHKDHAAALIDLDAMSAVKFADDWLPGTDMQEGRPGKPLSHRYYLVPFASIPEWARSQAAQGAPAALEQKGHSGPFLKHFKHAETGEPILCFVGTGGQVVCPPSLHPDGERREWVGGQPGLPAVVPFLDLWDAVCGLVVECGGKIPAIEGMNAQLEAAGESNDNGQALNGILANMRATSGASVRARAVMYLAAMPPAVARQGGHSTLMTAARVVVYGFDLGQEVGFDLLATVYNQRCVPPWSEKELRHKCHEADTVPFRKPRGWLLKEPPPGGEQNGAGGPGDNDGPLTGAQIILAYFQKQYDPRFRRSNAIICRNGLLLARIEACDVPTSPLIARLADATNAPRHKDGMINENSLPAFFKTWAKVAWGDLLAGLLDEDHLAPGTADAAISDEEFRRMVTDALLSEIIIGEVIEATGATQTERRSVIDWCEKFAVEGPWRSIRSKKIWCKRVLNPGGEYTLKVAMRHELFSQLRADRQLCQMSLNTFSRRAKRAGIGHSNHADRPHGRAAVILSDTYVSDLTAGVPDDEPATNPCR